MSSGSNNLLAEGSGADREDPRRLIPEYRQKINAARYEGIEGDRKLKLDQDTYEDLLKRVESADYGYIDTVLGKSKEGLGIFGVRRANEEYAKRIASTPGVSKQTLLTSGQNTTGVGSLGLFKQGIGR